MVARSPSRGSAASESSAVSGRIRDSEIDKLIVVLVDSGRVCAVPHFKFESISRGRILSPGDTCRVAVKRSHDRYGFCRAIKSHERSCLRLAF